MKQFLGGMLVASILWAGLFFAHISGWVTLPGERDETQTDTDASPPTAELAASDVTDAKSKRKRRGGRRGKRGRVASAAPMASRRFDTDEGSSGDDLGAPGSREVAMGAGGAEDQLSSAEIDQGIDRVFKGIERCLVMLPPDAPATGKVVFGMHIASSGQVTKVNIKGPNVMIKGETGACFRRTVQSIRYRGFDGPDMVVHYPVTFD